MIDFFKDWLDYLFNERRQDVFLTLSFVILIFFRSRIGQWMNEASEFVQGQMFNLALLIMSLILFDTLGSGGVMGIKINIFLHFFIAVGLMMISTRQLLSRGYKYADSQINTD